MLTMFLILICVLSVSVPESAAKSALRIVGGRDALVNEFPYVVQIETRKEIHMHHDNKKTVQNVSECTGAALTTTWTLSARHCIPAKLKMKTETKLSTEVSTLMIRYGFPQGKPSADDGISEVLKTKTYNRRIHGDLINDDVGLYMTEPIKIDKYAKISAIDYKALYGNEITLVGFGLTKGKAGVINKPFSLGIPLQVLDKVMLRSCDMTFPSMCAVPSCGHWYTPCLGDSGGPVIHSSGVVGVVAGGTTCTVENIQTMSGSNIILITSPISPYIDWIYSIIFDTRKETDNVKKNNF